MKKTLVTCITAFLCVVAVCISSVLGTNKLADAKVEAAKYAPASSASNGSSGSIVDNGSGDVTPGDSSVTPETPTDPATGEPDSTAADANNGGSATPSAGGNSSGGSSTKKPASSKPSTQAEILNYFNTSVNKVKTSSKGGVKNYEKNSQAGTFTLGGPFKVFTSVINSLVNKNMGEKKEDTNRKLTKADLKKYFPVEEESWSSKLTTANISSATLTEKNGKYVITIKVKSDALSTNPVHGGGNHGKAFSIVRVSTILENAGGAKSLIEGNTKVGYRDGRIVATIDPATGNLTHINYYYVWELNVTKAGTTVNAPFGIESDFTINW
ncbi:unknown [Ruminococcus sp. CAG:563]|nr:unknown [Ruminococcus sp. CAG:563]